MVEYKYAKIPENLDNKIIFLQVVKPLTWVDRKYEEKYDHIPVGAITWVYKDHTSYKIVNGAQILDIGADIDGIFKHAVHPENNRYGCNYDPSCFEILHTSFQKIRKR